MPSHGVARCRMVSHGIARRRTLSHAVASFGGYCEDSGGFCQNRASGGPLDKQVYSLDFLNGSREPCGAKQAPRGGRVGPPGGGDVEIAARPVGGFAGPWTGAGTPRGQPGGCPPAAPTPAHRLPHLPHISTAGGLAAAIGATTLIFSNPSPGRSAPARFACQPLSLPNRGRRGSRRSRGNPAGVPQGGRRGGRKAGQGGGTPPPLGGPAYPPLGGFWRGRGRGNPLRGCPAKRLRSSEKRCIDRS